MKKHNNIFFFRIRYCESNIAIHQLWSNINRDNKGYQLSVKRVGGQTGDSVLSGEISTAGFVIGMPKQRHLYASALQLWPGLITDVNKLYHKPGIPI